MPQVTLKIEVSGWDALEVRGMSEDEVMDEMQDAAYEKLKELQDKNGMEEDLTAEEVANME